MDIVAELGLFVPENLKRNVLSDTKPLPRFSEEGRRLEVEAFILGALFMHRVLTLKGVTITMDHSEIIAAAKHLYPQYPKLDDSRSHGRTGQ